MPNTDLVFKSVEISGFMSYPPKIPQKVILDTNIVTTVIGYNNDNPHGDQNGAGKSAIVDAILYVFYGRSPRVTNQGFLNYVDPGSMFVIGEANRDGIAFRVERGENPSVLRLFEKATIDKRDWRTIDGNKLLFETTRATKPETTKRIVELIGFDIKLHDVLLVNNSSERSCFFLKTEEDQRNIIERIFGFTVFTEKADNLRELRKEETRNLATKESAIIATRQANDRVMQQIKILEEKSNTWATETDRLVKFLSQQIRSYQKIDFDQEIAVLQEIEGLAVQIDEIDREVNQHRQAVAMAEKRVQQWQAAYEAELDEVEQAITVLEAVDADAEIATIRERDTLRTTIRELADKSMTSHREADAHQHQMETDHIARGRISKEIAAIENQIVQLNESKCPTCGQDWADTQDHIIHCVADLNSRTEEVTKIDNTLRTLKEKYTEAKSIAGRLERQSDKHKAKLNSLKPTTLKTIEDAAKASTQLQNLRDRLTASQTSKNPHGENIGELTALIAECKKKRVKLERQISKQKQTSFTSLKEATEAKDQLKTLEVQFDQLSQQENPHRSTIDNLRNEVLREIDETEIKELKKLIEHMTLLIKLLSDRDSPIRTSILHEWLPELNGRLAKYLDFLELPHEIVFDANMTANFTLNGRQLGFGNLSTGQKLRGWLATNKAFREVFELINYGINLFWVDELLDKGMSARGAEVSYRLLEQMTEQGKSVFLITHRQELVDMADHTMTITLENGVSTIHN